MLHPAILRRRRQGGSPYPSAPPSDGLIADWRFSEGSGTTVADETGIYDIDLTDPTTPNATWAAHGITTANGLVQTPTITGARTIVHLYRVPTDEDAKFLQSGPVASNQGPYGRSVPATESHWLAQGHGISTVISRADGQYAWSMTSGGWRLYIRELAASTDGIIGFGGRVGTTTTRYTEMKMAWGAVYNKTLSAAERAELFSFARGLGIDRGFYIASADCPTQADEILLMGQSNADGRGYITDLSAPDQARTYSQTKISLSGLGGGSKVFADLVLGSNHSNTGATRFGLEIPIANAREDASGSRPLYVRKMATGGTYLAPSTDINVSAGATWSTDEVVGVGASVWLAMAYYQYSMADALDDGIGLDVKGIIWFQGEQDALQSSTADVWETEMTDLIAAFDTYLALSDAHWHIARIFENPPDDATAYATVRTAQAAVVTALGARGTLYDTDSLLHGDYVHLSSTGLSDLADDMAANIW